VREVGQYRLMERIGAGGMGEVFKAEHRLLKRACVVKMVRQDMVSDETFVRRFKREVAAATQLRHPAAMQVYDYGQTSDGTMYYVMEHIPGLTLAQVVERAGPLVPARVVPILRQLCGALAEAHALGLVHRDIKPSNIMLGCFGGRADAVKLLDFGLVGITSGAETRMTRTDVFLGTPAYMSPEQASGADAGPKSDLYSLGAVAYFLLTGRDPFVADHPLKLIHAHLSQHVEPPSSHGARIPADLESVILRLLSKAPDDRFSSATEVDAALAHVAATDEWDDTDALDWWDRFGEPGATSLESITAEGG